MAKKQRGLGHRKTAAREEDDRRTRWKFGQNFLVDEGVVRQITDDVPTTPADWIIEIGPGQGALTRRLATRCAKVTALEIDPKWVEHIGKHPEWGNVEVVRADATRVDVEALLTERAPFPGARPLVVGNLPYNRAAPILFRFLPFIARFKSMHLMVQYEVGKRICAKPHSRDFGFLTVFVQNLAAAELIRKIDPEAFRPRPKVLSATVQLTPLPEARSLDPFFLSFAEQAFAQKRKKLTNVLAPFYPKAKVLEVLAALGAGENARAEDLSVPDFAAAFNALGPPPGIPAHRSRTGGTPEDQEAAGDEAFPADADDAAGDEDPDDESGEDGDSKD